MSDYSTRMDDKPVDRRTVEGRALSVIQEGLVVVDKADKTGATHAVIWHGELLPIRFTYDDAHQHLTDLRFDDYQTKTAK